MPLKWITNFMKGINANTRPGEISAGIAFGILLALQPGFTVVRIIVLAITFILKINMPALFLSLFLVGLVSPVFDVPLDLFGGFILNHPSLFEFFTDLYNMPLIPYTRFNDTLVMGGLAAGVIAWLPFFFLFKAFITLYRNSLREKIANSRIFKTFLKMPLISKVVNYGGKILSLFSK